MYCVRMIIYGADYFLSLHNYFSFIIVLLCVHSATSLLLLALHNTVISHRILNVVSVYLHIVLRGGSAVGRWTCDLQVAGSIPSRWLSRNIGQLSLASLRGR